MSESIHVQRGKKWERSAYIAEWHDSAVKLTVSETLRHGKGCNVEFDIHYSPYNFVG